ncbi:zinc-ribbon domain-containing protein [Halorientalis brevis]|uniref:Zinc-ribbon domain-containing protein n=1 Tax=Halorientalis brevis TaxID=1126241 RepID=A0ABD6C935_9EURY|nr:zinc-ribbon domain-containing protein [Halorientalis brevis]
MGRCRRCDTEIDDSSRFCPFCGAPQTEKAAEQLERYVKRQLESAELQDRTGSGQSSGRRELWDRISYVVGYLTVVVGLSLRATLEGKLLLFSGILVLPPTRRLLGRPLGRPFAREFMIGVYLFFTALAVVSLQFL